jgi:hypothetical protein
MSFDYNYRMKQWTPPARPEWVQRINEEGRYLDLKSVVPLDEDSLMGRAKANTGLSDFGSDDWYEPFKVLIKSFDDEADLSLMGRLMTRSDLLMHLEGRLRIEDLYKRHPEIDDQPITAPILIIGSGRCGSSAMQNLLACDPENGTPMHWEALLPAPPPEAASYRSDPRIAIADGRMTQWNRVTPEIMAMHEFGGDMPTELIQIETMSFQSVSWLFLYGFVPSYLGYMAQRSSVPALRYAKRVLKLLQWKNPRQRWILKSPDAMRYLPELFEVFPDLRLVWMHRDPLKAVSSMVSLIGTLFWIRSDKRLDEATFSQLTDPAGLAALFEQAIGWIEQGKIPAAQLSSIQYEDFVADPLATVQALYRDIGIELSGEGRRAMEAYQHAHPREKRPAHQYSTGDAARRLEERKLFERYQRFFKVRSEA